MSLNRNRLSDFDECLSSRFHDCSENAHCFNLRGTYTCSCREGFADLSENPVYPGRSCSAELIGCERCRYHGTCYSRGSDEQMLCECFQWYSGVNCQVNLKGKYEITYKRAVRITNILFLFAVLLIALITLGIILFALLFVFALAACCRRKRHGTDVATMHNRALVAAANGMGIVTSSAHKSVATGRHSNFSDRSRSDKRAMIQDTSSETSEDSNTLPYVQTHQKRPQTGNYTMTPAPHTPAPQTPAAAAAAARTQASSRQSNASSSMVDLVGNTNGINEQKDRSLTVMIPRAKYHPQTGGGAQTAQQTTKRYDMMYGAAAKQTTAAAPSVCSTTEAKLLSYLDASPSTTAKVMEKVGRIHSNA